MLAFLAPLTFIALAVLGGAILAIYLIKPRRPDRLVGSNILWRSVLQDAEARSAFRRIPPFVLMAIQLLALAAGVVALARPYVRSPGAVGPDALVLLDVSASMQATDVAPNRLASAEAQVQGMIDNLQPDQSMTLIAVADVPRVLAPRTGDRQALRQALASVEPTPRSANLPAALSLAASLTGDRTNAEAVVVGDGGLSLERSQVPVGLPFPVRYVMVGGAAENLAVAAFGTRRDGDALAALARIANDGVQPHQVTVDLQVDGLAEPPQQVSVEGGQSADIQWNDLPASAQQLEVRIEQPDALALDNAAWVVLGGQQATRVLLVTDGNTFLERALALRPGVSVVRASPADYAQPAGTAAYDLVVFDGFIPPTLPASGSLLVVDPPRSSPLANVGDELAVPALRASGAGSPLLANVALDTIHINRTRQLELPSWADAIVETPDTPLLLAGERQGQRVAMLGFDLHQSDLPLQPAFPVLVQNLLDWLVPGGGVAAPMVRAGQPEGLVAIPNAQSIDVVAPDGRRTSVAPPFPP
ncbi:MAG: VWA domain-containing protein, partial [Chloroflexi bacterium]|nr:VWA domain-containing protein [Chloroflexota bacterium]